MSHGYLSLVCDALEAVAAIAGRCGLLGDAEALLSSAGGPRQATGYGFRFDFEHMAVQATRDLIAAGSSKRRDHVVSWEQGAKIAFRVGRLAGARPIAPKAVMAEKAWFRALIPDEPEPKG